MCNVLLIHLSSTGPHTVHSPTQHRGRLFNQLVQFHTVFITVAVNPTNNSNEKKTQATTA